jgi:hypothetical protein
MHVHEELALDVLGCKASEAGELLAGVALAVTRLYLLDLIEDNARWLCDPP